MAGAIPRFNGGPVTYEVVETVRGSQLVEARTGSKVGVAAAGSVACLGVATKDATPVATLTGTDTFGNPTINISPVSQYVAVQGVPAIFETITYAANATFGALLKCAANGQVTPWVLGTDNPALIVARCLEPAGVTVGTKATGRTKILV